MDLTGILITQGATLVAAVATNQAISMFTAQRVKRLEDRDDAAPKDYVPRLEFDRVLAILQRDVAEIKGLVQAVIYSGGDRHAAIKSIEASADLAADLDLVTAYRPTAAVHEGNYNFLYLDTKGLVTYGIGCMLPSADEACKLPWRHQITDSLATAAEIRAEFARVKALPMGKVARFYFRASSLVLRAVDVEAQFAAKCDGFIGQLRRLFPAFSSFARSKQLALLDMIYNLGLGQAPHDDFKGSGLQQYTHLVASVNSRDWPRAAAECDRNVHDTGFVERNKWTRNLFLQVVG